MPVSFEILTDPIGSQLTRRIQSDEKDKNDITCYILASENVSRLIQNNITLSTGTIQSFRGSGASYEIVIRPPETAAVITVTIAEDAVTEGNPQTTQDIRVSTSFPDTDAETPTLLFSHGVTAGLVRGMTITPTRILIYDRTGHDLKFFTHNGTEQSSEEIDTGIGIGTTISGIDFINGDILIADVNSSVSGRAARYRIDGSSLALVENYGNDFNGFGITHTRLGITVYNNANDQIRVQAYGDTEVSEHDLDFINDVFNRFIAHQSDLLYLLGSGVGSTISESYLLQITDTDAIELVRPLNIQSATSSSQLYDLAIYKDTLYLLRRDNVQTIDIRPYRPMAKNTKTTIPIVFADEGETIDLEQYAPDAKRFIWDVGFDKPPFLSINANNKLVVATNAVREMTPVLVKLRGINYIDSQPFEFYLIIRQTMNPVVRSVSELAMRANNTYDLFQLTDADEITFRSGRTQPTDSSISDGVFRIGETGGTAHFTATNDNGSTHFQIHIVLLPSIDPNNYSDVFRHRVEIGGIEIPMSDLAVSPSVSESLDAILINEYKANEVSLSLKSSDANDYKYNDGIADNFWETNHLNPAGFQEPIKIYIESLIDGTWTESGLLFSGTILENRATFGETRVTLTCIDLTFQLQNTLVQNFGTLEKWDTLRQQSDEVTFQGVYVPDASLTPMQVGTGEAWRDRTKLTMRNLPIPSEGVPMEDTAYMTVSELQTSGGFLSERPVLRFMAQHRFEDVLFLINQIALNKTIYNTEIDLPTLELDAPFILNRGSVPFSVENTRITRLLTDWVYDSTNARILMLLSNPEAHIADLLVQYNLDSDSYRVLHTFDKDIVTHRIARRNANNYYILTSAPISQDRSAPSLPRPIDSTGYAYDAVAEESVIRIHHYNASTNTLTEHVPEDNSRPPQLGVQYHVGFENTQHIDAFEGIVKDYRGVFRWYSNNLYYRYATQSEFGVARVNMSGTTSEMISQARSGYWDHLNFAFDVTSGGDIYFVYAAGDALVIKRRTSSGTESTVLSDSTADGGVHLGAHEAVFHNDDLYITASIGRVELSDTFSTSFMEDSRRTYYVFSFSANRTNNQYRCSVTWSNFITGLGFELSDLSTDNGRLSDFQNLNNHTFQFTVTPSDVLQDITIVIQENALTGGGNGRTVLNISVETERPQSKGAGMVLYKCNVTDSSPSLTVLEAYDFVQRGACNLIVHDDAVHFIESPPALTQFRPINPDLDGYWTDADKTKTMGYNILNDPLGALKKVNSSGDVESLGNLQYTDRPYNVAATRFLSFDGDLHIGMGYGDLRELLRLNSLASKADNVSHFVYGKTLQYIVPTFETGQSRYASLADLAKKTNATFSFDNQIITVRDRSAYRAQTEGATGTGSGNLDFDGQNKTFPDSGYLRIDKELIGYTGISSGAFTGITRGVSQTEIVNHGNNTEIVYVDAVFQSDRLQSALSESTDTTRIYNVIRDPSDDVEVRDEESIAAYGERVYTLDLGLTRHDLAWKDAIFKSYLQELKDPKQLIKLTLKPTPYFRLGDVIGFRYSELVYVGRIVSITKNAGSTEIRMRTL